MNPEVLSSDLEELLFIIVLTLMSYLLLFVVVVAVAFRDKVRANSCAVLFVL